MVDPGGEEWAAVVGCARCLWVRLWPRDLSLLFVTFGTSLHASEVGVKRQ